MGAMQFLKKCACVHVCMCMYMCVCVCICVYVCVHVYVYVCIVEGDVRIYLCSASICMSVYVDMCT